MLDAFLTTTTPPVENVKDEFENENADPIIAMQEALDNYGDFSLIANGRLSWDSYLGCFKILVRQCIRSFRVTENEIKAKRLQAFKARNN
jgi:hypothetical protein